MSGIAKLNTATAILGLILVAAFAALMVWATILGTVTAYRFALAAAVLVVAVMEARVRLGLRLVRGRLFVAHLCASIVAFVLLVALAFVTQSAAVRILALVFVVLSGAAGGVLLYRGIKAHSVPGSAATV